MSCVSDAVDRLGLDNGYDICIEEECIAVGACDEAPCNVPGQHFPVPPASGSERFELSETESGEVVVTDTVTGLFWQGEIPETFDGCSAGPIGGDREIECMWWEAFAYCDALEYGGYADWHLPDEHELLSIVDFESTLPAVDEDFFPNTPTDIFGTASSLDAEYAWLVSTDMGRLDYFYKDFGALVRCARRDEKELTPRFERTEPVPGEPVVLDTVTNLVWQGCVAGRVGDESDCAGVETLFVGGALCVRQLD